MLEVIAGDSIAMLIGRGPRLFHEGELAHTAFAPLGVTTLPHGRLFVRYLQASH